MTTSLPGLDQLFPSDPSGYCLSGHRTAPVITAVPDGILIPSLRRAAAGDTDGAATIALSRRHNAVLILDGVAQTPAALGQHGLSIRSAWDHSATNLLRLARSEQGMCFWLRRTARCTHGSDWYDFAVDGAPATSWLAHPRTLTVLNNYLSSRLHSAPVYDFDEESSWTIRVRAQDQSRAALAHCAEGFTYRAGFPVPSGEVWGSAFSPSSAPLLLAG